MFLGRVVWSALVVKWSASLLASSFGFTVWDTGADPFIFLIFRQICLDLISANLLHHMSNCFFFLQGEELPFGFLLADTKVFSVSLVWVGLQYFDELADLFHPLEGFWREEGTRRLGGIGF